MRSVGREKPPRESYRVRRISERVDFDIPDANSVSYVASGILRSKARIDCKTNLLADRRRDFPNRGEVDCLHGRYESPFLYSPTKAQHECIPRVTTSSASKRERNNLVGSVGQRQTISI